ncbi:MAG: biotin transporter BioY [Clostridia bacterium]|nr:biotin transporter BioY [Clostridia bacterium]
MTNVSSSRFPASRIAICALFVALTAVCAQITIPIGAVPVSLSLLPVLLCAALLRPSNACWSMVAYMLIGLAGAPIFSNLQGGPAKLFGVTGGYILGYLPCVIVIALLEKGWGDAFWKLCFSMILGVAACYALGTVWFMAVRHVDFSTAMGLCVTPFLPFDAGKILLAAFLAGRLKPVLRKLMPSA